jgi:methyl-accepting chemotaxis protein
MFGSTLRSELQQCQLELASYKQLMGAISQAFALIEFTAEGEVIDASQSFLAVMGYGLDELRGQHHRIFCNHEQTSSPDYAQFWRRLGGGETFCDRYKRIAKGGREVWLEACYMPVRNADGKVVRVVKIATDITARMHAEYVTRAT